MLDLTHVMCSYGHLKVNKYHLFGVIYLLICNYVEFILVCVAHMGPCLCIWTHICPMNEPNELGGWAGPGPGDLDPGPGMHG